MPYQPHSEYRSPYPPAPPPAKSRPSAAWFVLGGVLLLVAVVIFGIAIYHFVRTIAHSDAEFHAIGSHSVTVPAGTERGLFVPQGRPIPRCQVRDGSGTPLHFRPPAERFTYGEWMVVRVFDTGDGHLVFTCPQGVGGMIRIALVPSQGDFARLGFLGVLLPLGLGGLGFLILLVTTVLWFSRRPPRPGMPYAVPPGTPYGAAPGYPPAYPPTDQGYPPADQGHPPFGPDGPPPGPPPGQA